MNTNTNTDTQTKTATDQYYVERWTGREWVRHRIGGGPHPTLEEAQWAAQHTTYAPSLEPVRIVMTTTARPGGLLVDMYENPSRPPLGLGAWLSPNPPAN